MNQLLRESSRRFASFSLGRPWKFLDLLRRAEARTLKSVALAVAITWLPLAVLCALRGGTVFLSFLTDYASQSRFLIILPVLILGAPVLNTYLDMVARCFQTIVPENQLSRFQQDWSSFERLRDSRIAAIMIVLITYAAAAWLGQYVSLEGTALLSWWTGGRVGFQRFSVAGTWGVFISYPVLVYFTLLWLWKQLLWTRFMRSMASLDLRLVAPHPDRVGGIGFVEFALLGQLPFCFCLGAGLAGAVANRVIHQGLKLTAFSHLAAVLVGAVLLVSVAPYFVFTPALMRMRRRGLLGYGALACAAGELFETRWLPRTGNLNQDVLTTGDFAAIHNLYGIVSNINNIVGLPVGRVDVYALLVAAFVPAVPVVLGSIPYDTVVHAAIKLLVA